MRGLPMSIEDKMPAFVPGVAEYLLAHLPKTAKVFEWGSGGSTLFFDSHFSSVVSVEHEERWAKEVSAKLSHRALVLFHPPVKGSIGPVSSVVEYNGRHFGDYVNAINSRGQFDLISVDGRCRPACLGVAVKHVRPGGLLLLDNADRSRYVSSLFWVDMQLERVVDITAKAPGTEPTSPVIRLVIWRKPDPKKVERES